ncbi:MAG: hypothetical protein ACKOW9_01965, partial [Candidatus Paceibacterota bacterium]
LLLLILLLLLLLLLILILKQGYEGRRPGWGVFGRLARGSGTQLTGNTTWGSEKKGSKSG